MTFPFARSAVVEVNEIDIAYFASLDLSVDDHESLAGTDQSRLQMRRTVVQGCRIIGELLEVRSEFTVFRTRIGIIRETGLIRSQSS